jgi:hypothetical protein
MYTMLIGVAGGSGSRATQAANDLEWSALTVSEKAYYEVGQLTLRNQTYQDLVASGMARADAVEDVGTIVERGKHMLDTWGVSGTAARIGPGELRTTWSTGGTPLGRAVAPVVGGSTKAGVVSGRASMETE